MRQRTALRLGLYTLLCLIVVGTTFGIGYTVRAVYSPVTADDASLSVFWEVWRVIEQYFYGTVPDETARTYGAVKGSLETLQDPYTYFIEPQQRDREQEELRGSFGGIGAWVDRTADGRVLLRPMTGRPAAQAGIQEGDELVAVDGIPVTPDTPFADVLAMVRGQSGQIVRLTVRRSGVDEPITYEVKREEIVTPSVAYEKKTERVGYIQLSIFNERSSDELQDAVRDLRSQGADRYVIDLRSNGGGLLPAAIDVASQFLDDGVVMYESRSDGTENVYRAEGKGILTEEPVVFLVNSATASASEIVAGAIQDHERGILIGTETLGKASVQLIFDLSDGSSVHVTNAHWLTPSRREINGVGLAPDIAVELTDQDREEGRDPQLARAIEYLEEGNPQ
jgi:carboxyl-terminal processing protease